VSQMIETEACEGYDWLLDSLEKTRAGGSRAALGLAVCGPVLLTPPKTRPTLIRHAYFQRREGPVGARFLDALPVC
jgi:hypothetical protein